MKLFSYFDFQAVYLQIEFLFKKNYVHKQISEATKYIDFLIEIPLLYDKFQFK